MPQQNELLPATPGEMLCNARRQQGRTIDEAANHLKIGSDKIEAMETDQWDLIAPAYCKGFARRYARFLKLPADGFEVALDSVTCEQLPVKSVFTVSDSEKTSSLKSFRVLTYIVATVFIVLPLVLAYTHFAVRWSQDEPLLASYSGGDLKQPARGVNPPQAEDGSELLHLQANMVPTELISATGKQVAGNYKPSKLDIELSADSWLSVTDASGRQLESSLRKGGHTYRYQGTAPFELQIGRVSATQVHFNGEPVDLQAYTTGDIANLEVGNQLPE